LPSPRTNWWIREFGPEDGAPIVLLHSIATNGSMWMPQVGPWAQRFRLLLVDLPGHGKTPPDSQLKTLDDYADRLMEIIPNQTQSPLTIVGLSLGGMIAQACALRHPRRLKALVIANTLAQSSAQAVEVWNARIKTAGAEGMRSQTADTLIRWFTPNFRSQNPLTLSWIQSMIESTSLEGYRQAAQAIQQLNHLERLSEIKCRTLVLTGTDDPVATPALARGMAERIPASSIQLVESAAHLSNIEQPVRFAEIVGAFLQDQPQGAAPGSMP
jgi:3-oxoadipate enol-lactonase